MGVKAHDGRDVARETRASEAREALREALRDGADANAEDEDGWTALMWAARGGGEHGAGRVGLLVVAGAEAGRQRQAAARRLTAVARR